MTASVTIATETPLQDDVRALVAELDAEVRVLEPDTPDAFNFPMTAEEMAVPGMTVWVARRDGAALGCCALRELQNGLGEVKRMYLRPSARGEGVAASLLAALEAYARAIGIDRLALETGHAYLGARKAYERAGFYPCGAFGDYEDSPYNVFYEKALSSDATSDPISEVEARR